MPEPRASATHRDAVGGLPPRLTARRRALSLDEALARAVGLSPDEVAALGRTSSAVEASAAASHHDQTYFTDASRLPQVVPV
ncbi:hypothetical protein ACSRUE_05185 [Sorangium sp. KYC3313]|uniref:hypothetical protein n=1 Tax=Sorangium sp. KYC3313 TaxID=3449740 RepID=UPI003F8C727F